MKKYKKEIGRDLNKAEAHFIERLSKESWTYVKTVADIVREPILILDKDLRVMAANDSFYRMFQVDQKDTEHTLVYKLGNGQWDIPELRKLLEEIIPKNTFFKDFEITHEFPFIGRKVMVLNARQIHFVNNDAPELFPSIIFLAIEDISPMMEIAETLAVHIKELAAQNAGQT
jgi:PAS domain-containing protein